MNSFLVKRVSSRLCLLLIGTFIMGNHVYASQKGRPHIAGMRAMNGTGKSTAGSRGSNVVFNTSVYRNFDENGSNTVSALLRRSKIDNRVDKSIGYFLLVEKYNSHAAQKVLFREEEDDDVGETGNSFSWVEVFGSQKLTKDMVDKVKVLLKNGITCQVFVCVYYYVNVKEADTGKARDLLRTHKIAYNNSLMYEEIVKERYQQSRKTPPDNNSRRKMKTEEEWD